MKRCVFPIKVPCLALNNRYRLLNITFLKRNIQKKNTVFFIRIPYYTIGIIPLNPISTTVSPAVGSYFPSAVISVHSKLLLVDKEIVNTTSSVSLPVTVKPLPALTQEPAEIGDVLEINNFHDLKLRLQL